MSREKTEECPVCGDMFSPQGLAGHLRMAHGVNTVDEVEQDQGSRKRDEVVRESQQTFTLVDTLSEIGNQREEIEEKDRTGLFLRDEGANEFLGALQELEREVRARLRDEGDTPQETVALKEKTEQVFDLIDRFARCREKRSEIEGASVSSTKEAEEALDRVERKIRSELEKVTESSNSHSTS